MAWKSLWCWLCAVSICLSLASPAAAAAQGKLTVTAPTAITSSAPFSMTMNYTNNGSTSIYDPDAIMYVSAHDTAGNPLPLKPDKVTVTANGTVVTEEWDTGHGKQVAIEFWAGQRESLPPGWNYNLHLTVKIIMPAGTASVYTAIAVFNHDNYSDTYADWAPRHQSHGTAANADPYAKRPTADTQHAKADTDAVTCGHHAVAFSRTIISATVGHRTQPGFEFERAVISAKRSRGHGQLGVVDLAPDHLKLADRDRSRRALVQAWRWRPRRSSLTSDHADRIGETSSTCA